MQKQCAAVGVRGNAERCSLEECGLSAPSRSCDDHGVARIQRRLEHLRLQAVKDREVEHVHETGRKVRHSLHFSVSRMAAGRPLHLQLARRRLLLEAAAPRPVAGTASGQG